MLFQGCSHKFMCTVIYGALAAAVAICSSFLSACHSQYRHRPDVQQRVRCLVHRATRHLWRPVCRLSDWSSPSTCNKHESHTQRESSHNHGYIYTGIFWEKKKQQFVASWGLTLAISSAGPDNIAFSNIVATVNRSKWINNIHSRTFNF